MDNFQHRRYSCDNQLRHFSPTIFPHLFQNSAMDFQEDLNTKALFLDFKLCFADNVLFTNNLRIGDNNECFNTFEL